MRAVVVTGVSSGIGQGIARVLLRHGVHVFGSVRSDSDAARSSAEFGTGFTPLVLDVRDEPATRRAADLVRAKLQGQTLWGLVNNAGVGFKGPLLHEPLDEIQQVLDVNLLGPLKLIRAFAALLGADPTLAGSPGRIINVSSVAGVMTTPYTGAYCAAKFGLEGLSGSLRIELARYGIAVIVAAPGVYRSALGSKSGNGSPERYDATDFGPSYRRFLQDFSKWEARGWPPERFGEALWEILSCKRPRARYFVGQFPFRIIFALRHLLPTGVMDRILGAETLDRSKSRANRADALPTHRSRA
jgi:NAD(P)-dependent dehydrogenase (short-subunit alcohol dehydrogenase family)